MKQVKTALVIGNSNYINGGQLKNPQNDAELMADTLNNFGFNVNILLNATLKQMQKAAVEFTKNVRNSDVSLFYYAGHGIQLNGINYLIPVDAEMESEYDTEDEAFDISRINRAFTESMFYNQQRDINFAKQGNKLNIMILDACRKNPFRTWVRGDAMGFKAINSPAAGTLIAFATREGEVASDGKGKYGLYTEKLVEQMKIPQELLSIFDNTRKEVLNESKYSQCPQEWNMKFGEYYFIEPVSQTFKQGSIIQYGSISIDTEIEGDLYIDNNKIEFIQANSKDNKIENIVIGEHIIEIKGKENFKQNITVNKDKTTTLNIKSNKPKIFIPDKPKVIIPVNFVLIKAGTFLMGSSENEVGRYKNDTLHQVTLTYDFMMCKYQTTQKEYNKIIGTNPSHFKGDDLPVENVSWFDTIKYCNALSKKENLPVAYNEPTGELLDENGNVTTDITKVKGFRLPTEAEWEYAARGGSQSKGYKYSGSNDIGKVAWYDDNSENKTHNVGTKKANELGIYDMTGNVWEWCSDWYGQYSGNVTNPIGTTSGTHRVIRSGGWINDVSSSRVAYRSYGAPFLRHPFFGFRAVRND